MKLNVFKKSKYLFLIEIIYPNRKKKLYNINIILKLRSRNLQIAEIEKKERKCICNVICNGK